MKVLRKMGFNNIIIGLTGNSLEEELRDFSSAGTDLVLMKPLRADVLDLILSFLKNGQNGLFPSKLKEKKKLQIQYTPALSIEWCSQAYRDIHGEEQEIEGGGKAHRNLSTRLFRSMLPRSVSTPQMSDSDGAGVVTATTVTATVTAVAATSPLPAFNMTSAGYSNGSGSNLSIGSVYEEDTHSSYSHDEHSVFID